MTTTDPGRTIGGRYRLDRPIGTGGMGTVWAGQDELLGRQVAVKEVRFPPELGLEEIATLRLRTLREARATARLSHPSVITTYDVVEEDGRPWIVMELLPAKSLAEALAADGPLPPRRVAAIGLDVLSALEVAHADGVVHRDVKPSNVLLTTDGRAVLTDFGIASVAGDPALTSTGLVLGSPAFMPPERARGNTVGPEGDLWSLGATLFAAAEGRPPYDTGNAFATLTAVISDPVPPMSAGGPLAGAVDGLLRKDPADRAGIAETRRLLEAAAAGAAAAPEPTRVVPAVGGTEQMPYVGEERRTRGPLVAGLVVGLLLLAGLVALAATTLGPDPGPDRPKAQASTSSTPASSTPPPSSTAPPDDGLPAGFSLYTDPSGFSVAVPDGWERVQSSGTAVDFREPGTARLLRIDQTDQPKGDPKKDWEHQEKEVGKDLENYQRIGIDSVDYRDWPAADWEFTFDRDGAPTHVIDRGFVTGESQAYAIFLSTPEDQWAGSQTVFQVAADTFQPAAGASQDDQGDQSDQGD